MNSLPATGLSPKYQVPNCPRRRRFRSGIPAVFSTLKASPPTVQVNEFAGDDEALRDFLKERELSGDFISKISDELWIKGVIANSKNYKEFGDVICKEFNAPPQVLDEENEGGFLKLRITSEWISADDDSAPMNKKMTSKLKRELLFSTVGIGTACSGYCLITLSAEAALSCATGVLFSCFYFHLLCKHVDNMSREAVPDIFTKKKGKKIGIRSEDLQDLFEKTVKGSSIALSSSRLVIPVAIYGLWELSQHFAHNIFDFQLVPAIVGLFAYKAAALVQVYRDNEDLKVIFPENARWIK